MAFSKNQLRSFARLTLLSFALIGVPFVISFGIYELTLTVFSLLLVTMFFLFDTISIKLICSFYLLYYIIPLPNISTYRGTITNETLVLYTLMLLLGLIPFLTTFSPRSHKAISTYQSIRLNNLFQIAVYIHLFVIYITLFFIYFSYGNILMNQEARFGIGGHLSYLIKSGIYVPLFFPFIKKNFSSTLIFLALPLLPALLIGSRGTVILILMAVVLISVLNTFAPGEIFSLRKNKRWKQYKKHIYIGITTCFGIIYVFYFIRREYSDVLLSNSEAINLYFESSSPLYYFILPLYAGLRETIGISNTIISNDYTNTFLNYPLFTSELLTVLPGEQPAPGKVLAKLIGAKLEGGLTPGILGGLYLDYGKYSIFSCLLFGMLIKFLSKKAVSSDLYKILFALTITQFFHLFHRGFLKPEYFIAYIVVFFYYLVTKLK